MFLAANAYLNSDIIIIVDEQLVFIPEKSLVEIINDQIYVPDLDIHFALADESEYTIIQ